MDFDCHSQTLANASSLLFFLSVCPYVSHYASALIFVSVIFLCVCVTLLLHFSVLIFVYVFFCPLSLPPCSSIFSICELFFFNFFSVCYYLCLLIFYDWALHCFNISFCSYSLFKNLSFCMRL